MGLGVQHGRASSLTVAVNRRTNREWQRFSLNNKQRKKGSKRIQMTIKMVTELKLTVVNYARPNQMQICACAWIYRRTRKLWKVRTGSPGRRAVVGCRAFGTPGRWIVAGRGPAFSKSRIYRAVPFLCLTWVSWTNANARRNFFFDFQRTEWRWFS